MKISIHSDVQAFDNGPVIGTKVLDKEKFLKLLEDALQKHDPEDDQEKGQHVIKLPDAALELVSSGSGRRTKNPDDFIHREYRGAVESFLKREFAEKVTGVTCVVYTREAYAADKEVTKDMLLAAFPTEDVTHCIVAVLAYAGPRATVSCRRFTSNMAGGNNEYDILARLDKHMTEHSAPKGIGGKGVYRDSKNGFEEQVRFLTDEVKRIRKLAGEVKEYTDTWCTVAD